MFEIEQVYLGVDSKEDYFSHLISSDFDGSPKGMNWIPIQVDTLQKGNYRDFPHFLNGKPVISAKVKQAVEPFIAHEVEFLSLLHDELELYMLNVERAGLRGLAEIGCYSL